MGFTRSLQGHFTTEFYFCQIGNPLFGYLNQKNYLDIGIEQENQNCEKEISILNETISALNKLRPK
jgi:hypothetical protein